MRVSTSLLAKVALDTMLDQQKMLSETQLQISTGRKILSPSDDPYGSARSLDLVQTIHVNEQYIANSGQAQNRLILEEGALEGVGNALQRVRELMVAANSDSQTPESREFISKEIVQVLEQVLALSNSVDSNGEFIFAGYQGKTKPFEATGTGTFNYFGDDGQRYLKVGSATTIALGDSGEHTFLNIKNGNGTFQTRENAANQGTGIIDPGTVFGTYVADNYKVGFIPSTSGVFNAPVEYYVLDGQNNIIVPAAQAGITEAAFTGGGFSGIPYEEGAVIQGLDQLGVKTSISGAPTAETGPPLRQDTFAITPSNNQSIFASVQNFVNTLLSPQNGSADLAHFHNAMNRAIVDMDEGIGRILEVRSNIGARLNTVDKQLEINESFTLQLNATLSEIQDLDYAEAITRLNGQLMGLEAAQNSYSRIQGLSLFDYL